MRTIVHLSDLHFGRVDPRIVPPLVDYVNSITPDLVAVSGDLTQRARRSQFVQARDFLQALSFPRIVVPGNHDVPLYNIAARFFSPLGRYRSYIATDPEPVYVDEELMVIGLNSARSNVFGGGRLNESQVARAAARFSAATPHLVKVVVTHHPFDVPQGHGNQHLVGRSQMAMEQLARVGANLFLAGHLHFSHIGRTAERYKIAGYSALIVQAGTLSTRKRGEPNSFNVLRLARRDIVVERHTWDEGHQAFAMVRTENFRQTSEGWDRPMPQRIS